MYQIIIFLREKAEKLAQTPISKFRLFISGRSKVRNFQISRRTSISVSLDRS